jgi:hypothetical protein
MSDQLPQKQQEAEMDSAMGNSASIPGRPSKPSPSRGKDINLLRQALAFVPPQDEPSTGVEDVKLEGDLFIMHNLENIILYRDR